MTARRSKPAPATEAAPLTVLPAGGAGSAVLVLPAWWGLNDFFKGLCRRLARAGYVAVAPDLYHGAVAATVAEAQKMRGAIKRPAAQAQVLAALAHAQAVSGRREVGVLGFSMGANYALWLAEQPQASVRALVLYYGTRGGDYADLRAAVLGHYAERDDYVAASGVQKLAKTLARVGVEHTFHTYPGTGHWFAEDDRPEAYDPSSAKLAWQRTLAFLKTHLPTG